MSGLKIHIIPALKDNYIYGLSDADGRLAVIDPGAAEPVIGFLNTSGFKLERILCTHHHWDHVNGIPELARQFGVPVWTSKVDASRIPFASKILKDGDLLSEELRILEVPGHTLGQIAFWFPKLQALFVGDTLFSCGCGRLLEGSAEQMFESLQKIKKLPQNTRIYFGHEYTLRNIGFVVQHGGLDDFLKTYQHECEAKVAAGQPTTPGILATELRINPFLKAGSLAEFRKWREARDVF